MTAPMRFASVCSGIEAASVAWRPLKWQAQWFAEVEAFACALLAHRYREVPNLGDMRAIAARVLAGDIAAPDLLCGGTPCQPFSVAGLRQSLADERGNLTIQFVELANAIDHVRARRGQAPCIVFWENVPGVLSTKDNAFGRFLACLAAEDGVLEPPEARPERGKSSRHWKWDSGSTRHTPSWSGAGAVYGSRRAIAWRTLDAQYFGVPQRRRRVFVVASARAGFDPAQVLFEWQGLRRDFAPRREARQTAPTIPACSAAGAGMGTDFDCSGGLIEVFGGGNRSGAIDVATARNACAGARLDFETETFLVLNQAQAQTQAPALAFPARLSGSQCARTADVAPAMGAANPRALLHAAQVRRLTPQECEALQGFPRGYTAIPWRGKSAGQCPDGLRYKALGNSWAVPNVAWIGRRIDAAVRALAATGGGHG